MPHSQHRIRSHKSQEIKPKMKNLAFVLLAVQLLVCSQATWVLARAQLEVEQGTSSGDIGPLQEPIFRELQRHEPSTSASQENTFDPGAEIELDTDNRQFVEHGAEIIAGKSAVGELPADERELYTRLLALNQAQAKMAAQVEAYRTNSPYAGFDRPAFRLGDTWRPDEPLGANINNYAPDNFNGQDVMRLFEMHREVSEQLKRNNEATGESDHLRATELRDLNREVREMYKKAMLGHAPAVENSPGIDAKLEKHDNVLEEDEEDVEDEECAICRESLKAEPSVRLVCGHVYHESCLASWARIQSTLVNTCPRCREVFRLPYRMVPRLSSEH